MQFFSCFALGLFLLGSAPVLAQKTTKRRPTANGYHHTTNVKAKPRSGAYSRYDRSGRRDEENLKLAPGLRLNMPSPPTTDYMGRPLKKKAPATARSGATTLTPDKQPAAPAATTRKRR